MPTLSEARPEERLATPSNSPGQQHEAVARLKHISAALFESDASGLANLENWALAAEMIETLCAASDRT